MERKIDFCVKRILEGADIRSTLNEFNVTDDAVSDKTGNLEKSDLVKSIVQELGMTKVPSEILKELQKLVDASDSGVDLEKILSKNIVTFSDCSGECLIQLSPNKTIYYISDKVVKPNLFYAHNSVLKNINHLKVIGGKNLTTTASMFYLCDAKSIDVSSLNTSKVTSLHGMFSYCHRLRSLDLSNFNISKVTNMSWMFCLCKSLRFLDLSSFKINHAINYERMFDGCNSLSKSNIKFASGETQLPSIYDQTHSYW